MTIQEATEEQLRDLLLRLFRLNATQPLTEGQLAQARATSEELICRTSAM